MWPSVEVRWFYRGAIPPAVGAWFRAGLPQASAEPVRTDRYLRLPGNQSLGIKVRGGLLELKQRQESFGLHSFSPRAKGWVERWRKWGFPVDETDASALAWTAPHGHWVDVEKARWTALLPYPLAGSQADWMACLVELTQVQAAGQTWWTVGLETAREAPPKLDVLVAVAREVLQGDGMPELALDASYGYPGWLDRHL
ncbi:MAG: hypothetical protein PVH11_02790 [Anaerolineae bacterium]|jgi:hypothetical protein